MEKVKEMDVVKNLGVSGIKTAYAVAKDLVDKAVKNKGKDFKVAFPDTAYFLPLSYAAFGEEITTLGDVSKILEIVGGALAGVEEKDLLGVVDAAVLAAVCAEIIEVLNYAENCPYGGDWQGFIPDNVLRSLGLQLVDGRMPGVAVIVGAAPNSKIAADLVRGLQERSILSLLVGNTNGVTLLDQLKEENVNVGLSTYIVPLGKETTSVVFAANFAVRAALIYGGSKKGEAEKVLKYCQERVPAFVIALGALDEVKVACALAAVKLGFPVVTDQPVPEVGKTPYTKYEALISEKDYHKIIGRGISARDIKLKVSKIDIPVYYGAAFEGERVRREQMHCQFGGKYSTAFEYLRAVELNKIEDGHIEIIGPEIDEMKEGEPYPLGIFVEVAGRKMRGEFEPIVERQVHTFLNEASGIFHMGQRDMCWIRISKEAKNKGFKIKHFGTILHARIHNVFGAIVDKVSVKLYTNEEKFKPLLKEAQAAYEARDARMKEMTDESVDTFYSCTLCQSFAPNHVCIVKPERLGLCGAYNWLDAKASYELNPVGPNQPVKKGDCISVEKGEWRGVNDFIYQKSNKSLERFYAYSIMEYPETSCGCFECIAAVVPEANGFMIVNREYSGMTPVGMKFTTLAGSVGGGAQTPGFMGIGRLYIVSKKFLKADGGLKRLVWMPKELKEALADKLRKRGEEEGDVDFINKIADETNAVTSEELLVYLEKVKHPALTMPALL